MGACAERSLPPDLLATLSPPTPCDSHVGPAKDSSLIPTGSGLGGEGWKVRTASGVPGRASGTRSGRPPSVSLCSASVLHPGPGFPHLVGNEAADSSPVLLILAPEGPRLFSPPDPRLASPRAELRGGPWVYAAAPWGEDTGHPCHLLEAVGGHLPKGEEKGQADRVLSAWGGLHAWRCRCPGTLGVG